MEALKDVSFPNRVGILHHLCVLHSQLHLLKAFPGDEGPSAFLHLICQSALTYEDRVFYGTFLCDALGRLADGPIGVIELISSFLPFTPSWRGGLSNKLRPGEASIETEELLSKDLDLFPPIKQLERKSALATFLRHVVLLLFTGNVEFATRVSKASTRAIKPMRQFLSYLVRSMEQNSTSLRANRIFQVPGCLPLPSLYTILASEDGTNSQFPSSASDILPRIVLSLLVSNAENDPTGNASHLLSPSISQTKEWNSLPVSQLLSPVAHSYLTAEDSLPVSTLSAPHSFLLPSSPLAHRAYFHAAVLESDFWGAFSALQRYKEVGGSIHSLGGGSAGWGTQTPLGALTGLINTPLEVKAPVHRAHSRTTLILKDDTITRNATNLFSDSTNSTSMATQPNRLFGSRISRYQAILESHQSTSFSGLSEKKLSNVLQPPANLHFFDPIQHAPLLREKADAALFNKGNVLATATNAFPFLPGTAHIYEFLAAAESPPAPLSAFSCKTAIQFSLLLLANLYLHFGLIEAAESCCLETIRHAQKTSDSKVLTSALLLYAQALIAKQIRKRKASALVSTANTSQYFASDTPLFARSTQQTNPFDRTRLSLLELGLSEDSFGISNSLPQNRPGASGVASSNSEKDRKSLVHPIHFETRQILLRVRQKSSESGMWPQQLSSSLQLVLYTAADLLSQDRPFPFTVPSWLSPDPYTSYRKGGWGVGQCVHSAALGVERSGLTPLGHASVLLQPAITSPGTREGLGGGTLNCITPRSQSQRIVQARRERLKNMNTESWQTQNTSTIAKKIIQAVHLSEGRIKLQDVPLPFTPVEVFGAHVQGHTTRYTLWEMLRTNYSYHSESVVSNVENIAPLKSPASKVNEPSRAEIISIHGKSLSKAFDMQARMAQRLANASWRVKKVAESQHLACAQQSFHLRGMHTLSNILDGVQL